MPICNRRSFMTRTVLGAAVLATAGRAFGGADPRTTKQTSCANCQFYLSNPGPTSGAKTGTCAFAGRTVSADGGCGEFAPAKTRSAGAAAGAGR